MASSVWRSKRGELSPPRTKALKHYSSSIPSSTPSSSRIGLFFFGPLPSAGCRIDSADFQRSWSRFDHTFRQRSEEKRPNSRRGWNGRRNGRDMYELLRPKEAKFRAIAPDYRGYGLSDPPPQPEKATFLDLDSDLAILDALDIPKVQVGLFFC